MTASFSIGDWGIGDDCCDYMLFCKWAHFVTGNVIHCQFKSSGVVMGGKYTGGQKLVHEVLIRQAFYGSLWCCWISDYSYYKCFLGITCKTLTFIPQLLSTNSNRWYHFVTWELTNNYFTVSSVHVCVWFWYVLYHITRTMWHENNAISPVNVGGKAVFIAVLRHIP